MIPLKSKEEIAIMKNNGLLLFQILSQLKKIIKPDITTSFIDKKTLDLFDTFKVKPAFKNYKGYPACVCTSINEEVVHGIPSQRTLQEGDIISLDLGLFKDGFFADSAITMGVGEIDDKLKKLIDVTKKSLFEGIKFAFAGKYVEDISYTIQNFVESKGFSVVHQYVGHGIGRALHEEPEIPNFASSNKKETLIKEGMVFAVEPMVNMGSWQTKVLEDGWTAVTCDNMPSAHFEHMVAITENGPLVLTQNQ